QQARAAEGLVAQGAQVGPFHGVPLSLKSCIDVAGWPCPAGSLLRKDYVSKQDAPLVSRLKSAGAILLGNTNTPEFLMAYETNNLLSGRTSNPWNLAHSPGGSSGGEAAAIAAGCSAGGVGSDGGGSLRGRAVPSSAQHNYWATAASPSNPSACMTAVAHSICGGFSVGR